MSNNFRETTMPKKGVSEKRGVGVGLYLNFFKEWCFRVRVRVKVKVDTNPKPNPNPNSNTNPNLTLNLTITLTLTLTLTLTRTWTRIQIPRFTDTTKKLGTVNLNYIAKDSTNKFLRQYLCLNFSSRLLYIFHTFQFCTFSREIFN